MGYDDDECVVCYQRGWGNETAGCKDICLCCMGKLMEESKPTQRVKNGLTRHLDESSLYEEQECFLCKKMVNMTFSSPCCGDHKRMYCDDDDEDDSQDSREDSKDAGGEINDNDECQDICYCCGITTTYGYNELGAICQECAHSKCSH